MEAPSSSPFATTTATGIGLAIAVHWTDRQTRLNTEIPRRIPR